MSIAEKKKEWILVYDELSIGSTDIYIGIYQVIASLRRLGQWMNQDYRL